jgi:hypothetical protein
MRKVVGWAAVSAGMLVLAALSEHSFYVGIRKFRLTIGGWASGWAPPPAL